MALHSSLFPMRLVKCMKVSDEQSTTDCSDVESERGKGAAVEGWRVKRGGFQEGLAREPMTRDTPDCAGHLRQFQLLRKAGDDMSVSFS